MSEKESKFDREVREIRSEHKHMSGGLELAQNLRDIGDHQRKGIMQRIEGHRQAIQALNLTEQEKAQHLATMSDEVLMPELSAQQQKDDRFVRERQVDYDKNIDQARKHYEKHKDAYLEAALREATEAGIPISTSEGSNLAEIHDPQTIYPGLTENELAHLQHLDQTLGTSYVKSLLRMSEQHYNGISTPESVEKLAEFLRMTEVNAQIRKAMLEKHHPKGIFARLSKLEHKLELEDVPLLDERLEEITLDTGLRQQIFASWASCQPLALVMRESMYPSLRREDIEKAAAGMADYMCEQLEGLMGYAEMYGPEETEGIIETFGIHHFSRYAPEQLHFQLLNWEDPGLINPMKHIVISPHDDWNTAMSGTGKALGERLPEENTVYFEAGDAAEMARQIVAVGNRERRAGRDPERLNLVENVIISGHGSPEGLVLGNKTGEINLDMYDEAAAGRERINARINTYRRHLGSKFQVILDSCSTAGVTLGDKNIATEMSDSHDALVHASPVTTYGSSKKNVDGEVVYRISPKNAWMTAARYDGRHGEGVTESTPFRTRLARWAHFLIHG